jgi:methylthioribose-1-phosphate isomerase
VKPEVAQLRAVDWSGRAVRILDQTLLPGEVRFLDLLSPEEVAEAIRGLRVRGAPAIGVAAALGVALAGERSSEAALTDSVMRAIESLGSTRPTAVNLSWALGRMRGVVESFVGKHGGARDRAPEMKQALLGEALLIMEEDRALCSKIGENGEPLLEDGHTVLTHCNAGALATAGMGTALAVVYAAVEKGKRIKVIADETRPLLQGARLTAWELVSRDIEVTVICDSAAAWLMKQRRVDCVLIGADRVARNGDLANKVGSYSLAIAAREHQIPFYSACPHSTIDLSLANGSGIQVEERGEEELRVLGSRVVVPDGAGVYNPAFDVVPHAYVSAIITDRGVVRPPYEGKLGG